MKHSKITLMQRAWQSLALQEAVSYLGLLLLPGGSVMALTAWVYRHWPLVRSR